MSPNIKTTVKTDYANGRISVIIYQDGRQVFGAENYPADFATDNDIRHAKAARTALQNWGELERGTPFFWVGSEDGGNIQVFSTVGKRAFHL